jgi:hypothetical protein
MSNALPQEVAANAVIVEVSYERGWDASKFDRALTEETANAHGMTGDAGRFSRYLMPAKSAYQDMVNAVAAHRAYFRKFSRPWEDNAGRVIAVKSFERFVDGNTAMRATVREAHSRLIEAYPYLKEWMYANRRPWYDEGDYPADLTGRWVYSFDVRPIVTGSDFRVALPQQVLDAERAKLDAEVARRVEAGTRDLTGRLSRALTGMFDSLLGKKLYQASFDGLAELADIVDSLDFGDVPGLSDVTQRIRESFSNADAKSVTKDDVARTQLAIEVARISDTMKGLF